MDIFSVIESEGKKPKIHPSVFLAPGSWVIGDVTLEEDVNVGTNAVIRGDDDSVVIGASTTFLRAIWLRHQRVTQRAILVSLVMLEGERGGT